MLMLNIGYIEKILKKKILFFVLILSGCAPTITSLQGSYNSIDVELSDPSKNRYVLISSNGSFIERSKSTPDDRLVFDLSESASIDANTCFTIKDIDNKDVLLPKEIQNHINDFKFKNEVFTKYKLSVEEYDQTTIRISNAKKDISNNIAFKLNTCVKPRMDSIPNKPCDPNFITQQYATALCAVSNIQSNNSCTLILEKIDLKSIDTSILGNLKNPECDILSSKLLIQGKNNLSGDNFGKDDDTHALIDEYSKLGVNAGLKMMFFEPLTGLFTSAVSGVINALNKSTAATTKAAIFSSCINNVVTSCQTNYSDWERNLLEIKTKPDRILNECFLEKNNIEKLENIIFELKERINDLKTKRISIMESQCITN